MPERPDFAFVRDTSFRRQLTIVYSPAAVFDIRMPLELNGKPFGTARVGVSTVFLKNEVTPRLRRAVIYSTGALLISLILAAGLSHLALRPVERISLRLDSVIAGETREVLAQPDAITDAYGLGTPKHP